MFCLVLIKHMILTLLTWFCLSLYSYEKLTNKYKLFANCKMWRFIHHIRVQNLCSLLNFKCSCLKSVSNSKLIIFLSKSTHVLNGFEVCVCQTTNTYLSLINLCTNLCDRSYHSQLFQYCLIKQTNIRYNYKTLFDQTYK